MKKLIFLELSFLFFATTFSSNPPPGWYQVPIPIGDKFITDIKFINANTGWVITDWTPNFDSSYILKTTNGGDNWELQLRPRVSLASLFMIDLNIGYAGGGDGTTKILKTTNGGTNWFFVTPPGILRIHDIYFVNPDTGWTTVENVFNNGIYKTTDGGNSWQIQITNLQTFYTLFMLNKDTGWAALQGGRLYRTINGGSNWVFQYIFPFNPYDINDIFFFDKDTGIVTSATSYRTTNGGFNWIPSNNGGIKVSFADYKTGWAGDNFNDIIKTTNGGINWFYQSSPIYNNSNTSSIDTFNSWAGGNGLVHTTDGGPPSSIKNFNNYISENYKLYQNYPNPFNPNTVISYELLISSFVKLKVFNIEGREIDELINKRQNEGEYEFNFSGDGLTSGVYFYRLEIFDEKSSEVFIDTKKMILLR